MEEQEALRCTFHEDQYANVQESQEIDFTYYDLQILSSKEKDEKLEEIRKDLFERNFNINKGPLICFVATRIDDKKTIVHMPRRISSGWREPSNYIKRIRKFVLWKAKCQSLFFFRVHSLY